MSNTHTARLAFAALASMLATGCGAGAAAAADDAPGPLRGGETSLDALALDAIADDPTRAEHAIAALREAGPAGHRALVERHGWTIVALREAPPGTLDPSQERLRHALDVVSGQRDGHASGLYWHTDLAAAEEESRRTGRPILSLRLLGRLDEEMSCANSRYFRLVLYPNAEVSRELAEHWVLHWSSERPVPRVTIDMGDGRRLERTLTGNSVHYALDADGRVIDALPGLYGPREMLVFLGHARHAHTALVSGAGEAAIAAHLEARRREGLEALRAARARLPEIPDHAPAAPRLATPSAIDAMPLTVSKAVLETPLLDALRAPGALAVPSPPLDWSRAAIAFERDASTVFDARSRALLRLKTGRDEDAVAPLVDSLSRTVSGDSARNDATFRLSILDWLLAPRASDEPRPSLERFNERVYRDLFLTPASDPWLGLADPAVWDAIERLH